MSRLEDGLREVLTDHARAVMPPPGWEHSVLKAGRRRQLRRRLGAMIGAAVAVFAVVLAANVVVPNAWRGLDPSARLHSQEVSDAAADGAAATVKRVKPAGLRTGASIQTAYAAGDGSVPPGDIVVLPTGGQWKTGGSVTALEQAGKGAVAEVSADTSSRLVYRWSGGTRELVSGNLAGFAVSANGTQVAWAQVAKDGGFPAVLNLADLPSGKVVDSFEVDVATQPSAGVPFVTSFVGDRVLLSYDVPREKSPPGYAWNPAGKSIEPLAGPKSVKLLSRVVDVSTRSDTVLALDRNGCLVNLSVKEPAEQRWHSCDRVLREWPGSKRLSPLGTRFAGVQGSLVWVRDTRTGRLLWSQELLGATADGLAWESEDRVLVTYDSPGDASLGRSVLRCEAVAPSCERPATVDGLPVTALSSRQGTDPPLLQR